MHPVQLSEDLVPIAAFKARVSAYVRGVQKHRRPVVITQHGRPAAVVLSPADYDLLGGRGAYLTAIREGLADAKSGRTISDDEMTRRMERRIAKSRR